MSEQKYHLWMKEAKTDFQGAVVLLKQNFLNLAVFHFVQAGEKAIKALLYLNKTRPWGHSITSLLEEYEDLGKIVGETIKNSAITLEPHYITSRYPGDSLEIAPSEAYEKEEVEGIKTAAEILIDFSEREKDKGINSAEEEGDEE
jgi:HEPN domain-containing protein